eukprot:g1860.t1
MSENVTELWLIVEALQLELATLTTNVTLSGIDGLVTASQVDSMATDMNSFWLMLGAILIVFMQAGFAMLEVGAVGTKHTNDILIKNMLDMAVAAMVWWSFGWAVAYGEKTESGNFNQFLGPGSFFTRGEAFNDETGNYGTAEGYNWALWHFQIHSTGGMAALVMVILTGPFLDRAGDLSGAGGNADQSVINQALGAFILWVGWYAFNGCSTLFITGSSHVAAKAMVCTTVSAASAGLGVTSASLVLYQHVGPSELINGLLSGLVAITGCCAVVEVEGAFFIGLVAATNYLAFSRFMELVLIDDMVDAAPVHLANGIWGMIAGGLFASKEGYSAAYYADRSQQCCGWLYGCGSAQLMANVSFLSALLCWTGFTTLLVGSGLKHLGVLRISKGEERWGMVTAAVKSTETTAFVKGMLRRIENLAAKGGDDDDDHAEGTHTLSSRRQIISSGSVRRESRTVLVGHRKKPELSSPADNAGIKREDLAGISEANYALDDADMSVPSHASDENPSRYTSGAESLANVSNSLPPARTFLAPTRTRRITSPR